MNKNVLTVLIVILIPIIILGVVAVAGAEEFEKQKEASENEHTGENATEVAEILAPMSTFGTVSAHTTDYIGSSVQRVLV